MATTASEHRAVMLLRLECFDGPLGSLVGSRGSRGLVRFDENGIAILTRGEQEEVAIRLLGRKVKLIHSKKEVRNDFAVDRSLGELCNSAQWNGRLLMSSFSKLLKYF